MAEGHTIHRLARDLRELVGPPLSASSPQGRFSDAKLIDGLPMLGTDAYGKHLLLEFEIGFVHIHLGMVGKFHRLEPAGEPGSQVRLRLATGDLAWDLVAPARCELWDREAVGALVARLGPDPLRPQSDPELVWRRLQRSSGPIGAFLLDQSVIAGVGNIYRVEALFVLGIHPSRPAAGLSRSEFDALWTTLQSMMRLGVEEGRIITVDAPPGPERLALPVAEARWVYKQQVCRRCGTPVEKFRLGNRTAYACPRDQS
jgi:endonuclease-8